MSKPLGIACVLWSFVLLGVAPPSVALVDKPPVTLPASGGSSSGGGGVIIRQVQADEAVRTRATGIYIMARYPHNASTYGLFHQGRLLEVHTRQGRTWLRKRPGHRSVRSYSTAQFQRLIDLAGANRNVENNADLKKRFYQAAGLSSTAPRGGAPGATPGATRSCPDSWNRMTPAQRERALENPRTRRMYLGCVSWKGDSFFDKLAALWRDTSVQFFRQAHARVGKLIYLTWTLGDVFECRFEYRPDLGFVGFRAAGFTAVWYLIEDD